MGRLFMLDVPENQAIVDVAHGSPGRHGRRHRSVLRHRMPRTRSRSIDDRPGSGMPSGTPVCPACRIGGSPAGTRTRSRWSRGELRAPRSGRRSLLTALLEGPEGVATTVHPLRPSTDRS